MISGTLASATSVELGRATATTPALVSFAVVELPGVSVRSGTAIPASFALVGTGVGPIDVPHAAAFLSPYGGRGGQDSDFDEVVMTAQMQGDTIQLDRNAMPPTDVGSAVAWSIVEWQ